MRKGLAYSSIAMVLGILIVIVPLLLLPTASTGFREKFLPQMMLLREKSLEEYYRYVETSMRGCPFELLTVVVGLAAAVVAYTVAKTRLSF